MKNRPGKDRPALRLACPLCGNSAYAYSRREHIFWCRRCGHEWSRLEMFDQVKHGGREGTDSD